tara:strand:- start:109 stop:312 length:204 start_codon:yes stop_codon:yes gene_type:complete
MIQQVGRLPETPGSDLAVKIMSIILWIMIVISIVTICLMVLATIIAVAFVTLDINYDWSWMLAIGKT